MIAGAIQTRSREACFLGHTGLCRCPCDRTGDVPLQTSQPVAAGQSALKVSPRQNRRDGLGTTYHEAGMLAMDEDPALSGANADALLWVPNLYAAGPGLFPTVGSPNPILTCTALDVGWQSSRNTVRCRCRLHFRSSIRCARRNGARDTARPRGPGNSCRPPAPVPRTEGGCRR